VRGATVYRRLSTLPGSVVLATLAIYTGAAGLLSLGPPSSDALALVLPDSVDHLFEAAYLLAGVLMIAGIATGKARVEGPGWILLGMSVLVRAVAFISLVGFVPEVTGALVLYAVTAWASYVRVRSLARGEVIVRAQSTEGVPRGR
jgi:hypothetical protein